MGDFVMPEVAIRLPLPHQTRLEARYQHKLFIPHRSQNPPYEDYFRSYTHGPGLDLIVRRRVRPNLVLFTAVFAEYLVGGRVSEAGLEGPVPDNCLVRNQSGLAFVGRAGEIQIYGAVESGHGKGLLAFQTARRWDGGIRLSPF